MTGTKNTIGSGECPHLWQDGQEFCLDHPGWQARVSAQNGGLKSWGRGEDLFFEGVPGLGGVDSLDFSSFGEGEFKEGGLGLFPTSWPLLSALPVWGTPPPKKEKGLLGPNFRNLKEFSQPKNGKFLEPNAYFSPETVLLPFGMVNAKGKLKLTWSYGPSLQDLSLNITFQAASKGWLGFVWRLAAGSPGQMIRLKHVHREVVLEPNSAGYGRFFHQVTLSDPPSGRSTILEWTPAQDLLIWPIGETQQEGLGILCGQSVAKGERFVGRFSLFGIGN